MERLKKLFENNKKWIEEKTKVDSEYFLKMSKAQAPPYLWIGCSDSRVPANEIVGLEAGELFVHRNVANLFLHTDMNSLSVLEFAIDYLKIQHVIVCGHYNCGGVIASMKDHKLGLVDNWLRNIRDVYSKNREELDSISSEKERQNRLVELNVIQQLKNISRTTMVQGAWQRGEPLMIHGWVYDLETGKLKDLGGNIKGIEDVDPVYRIQMES